MESETGAKIQILGKGINHKVPIRRGEGEPLHAYVTSTNAEAVKKAVDKIKNIIKEAVDVPLGQNDLRRRIRSRSRDRTMTARGSQPREADSSSDKNRPPSQKRARAGSPKDRYASSLSNFKI